MTMHLLVDISAHGLGHLAQTAPVLAALGARVPELRLTLRSALPRRQLARYVSGDFAHIAEARDIGLVMHNAVDIDLAASATAYRDFHRDWQQRVDIEAAWLKAHQFTALLTNVAYLPLAAAARAGLPCASLCSLNWADLFVHYFGAESWAAQIHEEMLSAYRDADGFLRVSPGLPMRDLDRGRLREIAPIARLGKRMRAAISRELDIAGDHRWILVAMGGMDLRLPVEDWPRVAGVTWLVPAAWRVQRGDVRAFDQANIDFADILASADAVITKPGYATFVEAACLGIPILYVQRDDWPETPYLAAWLAANARSCALSRSRLMQGEIIEALTTLWRTPAPATPSAAGADEAAQLLQTLLKLR
jgi:hypothetical protein